jgi:hypothetical protein
MTPVTSDEVPRRSLRCSWPLRFFERRQYFNREAENQPYIKWLRDAFRDAFRDASGEEWKENEEDEDDEDEDDDDEDNDDEDGGASVCISRLCPLI